jgi:transposase
MIGFVPRTPELPDDIDTLKAALIAERAARQEAQARAAGAEAMVAHLKVLIAKMRRDRKLLDQLELQLEELEASATEDEAAAAPAIADATAVRSFTGKRPVRAPLPAHLPRGARGRPGTERLPLGRRLHCQLFAAARADPPPCARRRAPPWR